MQYFTADLHFNHKNIVGPEISKWTRGYRKFKSLGEMHDVIIDNINQMVQEDDELYIIGDFCFGSERDIVLARRAFYCKKVHLLIGSHDQIFLKPRTKYLQGLFYSVSDRKEVVIENQLIILDHYAKRVWKGSNRGSWHLYGHSHGNLPGIGKSMDVGIDTNNYFPYSYIDIKEILDKKLDEPKS